VDRKLSMFIRIGALAFALLLLASMWFSDSSDDGSAPFPGDEPDEPDAAVRENPPLRDISDQGRFYARCLYRDHIDGDRFFLEIKSVARLAQQFPGVVSEGFEAESNHHAWVKLRGVYAPRKSIERNRHRPHIEVEREQSRYDELQSHVWRIFQSSHTLTLTNILVDTDLRTPEGYPHFTANIYYRIGGVDRDLAADLIADGYVIDDTFVGDFGQRIP